MFLEAILFFSTSQIAVAQTSASLQQTIQQVSEIKSGLKKVSKSVDCSPDSPSQCTFESACAAFSGKANDKYLYQDSEGHKVPNWALMMSAEMTKTCQTKPFVIPDDGYAFTDPKKMDAQTLKKASTRTATILEDARSQVLKTLENNKNSENAAQINNMISRIKSVKFKTMEKKDLDNLATSGCEFPNAFFDPSVETITVCPQMMDMPESTLFSVIAHELGHSIDPCTTAFNSSKDGTIHPLWANPWQKEDPSKKAVTTPAIPIDKNPFQKVITCLGKPSSLNAQIPEKESLLTPLRNAVNTLNTLDASRSGDNGEEGGPTSHDADIANFEEQIKTITDHYDQIKYCVGPEATKTAGAAMLGSSHINEAFADWISSQAMGLKLTSIPDAGRAKEYAFNSQAVFYSVYCPNINQVLEEKFKSAAKSCEMVRKIVIFSESMDKPESDHPETSARVNRVYFTKPEIKKAMGCQGGDNATECKN